MQGQPDERERGREIRTVERAIVLQILRDDHDERWSRAELADEISDFEPAMLDRALASLERDGVLHREATSVWAARAARRLDELELISI
jgi:DNA-binding HxlR family transcriptional regulator